MVYDWKAGIAFFITLVALTVIGRRVVFLVPAFQRMRELNHEVDKVKLKRARFKKAVKASSQIGLYTNLAFYLLVLPFAVNLEPRPLWRYPLETFIGLFLFLFSIPAVGILMGGPLNAFSMAIATLIFTQLNTINHTFVNLPYGPYKVVDYITSIHAAHHVDMNSGNYATLTMFYDWIFGTLEKPVGRPEA